MAARSGAAPSTTDPRSAPRPPVAWPATPDPVRWWEQGGPTDIDNLCLLCRRHHRLMHEGRHWVRLVDGHPRFYRPDGTWIRPPNPPPTNRPRGSTELRRRHYAAGQTITARTPEARDGGAGCQSPAAILDGLFN